MLHHVDVHVRNLESAEVLFDELSRHLGYVRVPDEAGFIGYGPLGGGRPRIGFTADGDHIAGSMRLAFGVSSKDLVDRAAEAARTSGACNFEGPAVHPEYGDDYYAVFFEDRDGNRYEVVAYDATSGSEEA